MSFLPGTQDQEGYLHKEKPAEYFKMKLMLAMLCGIFRRSSNGMRTPCTHIHPKSWSCSPASEEGLHLKGDKLSGRLLKHPKDRHSLSFLPASQKMQFSAFHSGRGVLGSDTGLQHRRLVSSGVLPNSRHAEVWTWSDGFVSLIHLSGPEGAGGRQSGELPS